MNDIRAKKDIIKIYIPESIPSDNKGEEAILQGILQGLDKLGLKTELMIFSYNKPLDSHNYGNRVKIIEGISFRPRPKRQLFYRILETLSIWLRHIAFLVIYRAIKEKCFIFFKSENWYAYHKADIIFIGHDGCISDTNLPFVVFAKLLGKKTILFGGGFKGFRLLISKFLAKYIMAKIDLIVVREEHTYRYFKSIGVNSNLYWKPDPAFLMKPAEDEVLNNMLKKEGLFGINKPLIGMIALRGTSSYFYYYDKSLDEEKRYEQHINFFARIAEFVIELTKGLIVFIPHCIQSQLKNDDREVARDIKTQIKIHSEDVILIENEYNAQTLKAFIGKLDFLISQRLHAVIGATTVGTPFIQVTVREDWRSHDIIERTIGRPDLVYDLVGTDVNNFNLVFKEKWEQREEIRQYLLKRAKIIEQECNKAFELIKNVLL